MEKNIKQIKKRLNLKKQFPSMCDICYWTINQNLCGRDLQQDF